MHVLLIYGMHNESELNYGAFCITLLLNLHFGKNKELEKARKITVFNMDDLYYL